ncbi:hypothetical protein Tco_0595089 [Tanacetum coccineum]
MILHHHSFHTIIHSCRDAFHFAMPYLSFLTCHATPSIPVPAEENLGDPIDVRMNIIHPEPVAVVVFPAATVVRTLAQYGEAIRGIQEQLVGVPIQEELMALRFRIDIIEAENASLRARNTAEAIEKITHNRKRQAREKMERQLSLIQEELESLRRSRRP